MHLRREAEAEPAAPEVTLVARTLLMDDAANAPSSIIMPTMPEPSQTVLGMATGAPSVPGLEPTQTTELTEPTSSQQAPADESSSSSGPSTGVQAGIAFGVLGGILVIGLVIYLIFSRRRKQAAERRKQEDKEKVPDLTDFGTQEAHSRTPSRPLDSPVSQPKPAMAVGNVDKPLPLPVATLDPKARRTSTYSNPFDNEFDAVSSIHPSDRSLAIRSRSPSPISLDEAFPRRLMPTAVTTDQVVTPLTRKTSLRQDNSRHVNPALSGSFQVDINPFGNGPFGNEHAIGAFVSEDPPPPTDGPVHRVQLDFKPTLEDEMSLKAGELVRLLYEFDDGWALCARFDKSDQGVIPRTCLSARAVRPRLDSNAGSRSGSRAGGSPRP